MTSAFEDFDADEAVVFPVEGDEGLDAGGRRSAEGGPSGRERLVGELEVDGVGLAVVGDAHGTSLA